MHAEICPICSGKGLIYEDDSSMTSLNKIECHGCMGKGWVEVRDEVSYLNYTGKLPKLNNKERTSKY